jgi:hypothetical protein
MFCELPSTSRNPLKKYPAKTVMQAYEGQIVQMQGTSFMPKHICYGSYDGLCLSSSSYVFLPFLYTIDFLFLL